MVYYKFFIEQLYRFHCSRGFSRINFELHGKLSDNLDALYILVVLFLFPTRFDFKLCRLFP